MVGWEGERGREREKMHVVYTEKSAGVPNNGE